MDPQKQKILFLLIVVAIGALISNERVFHTFSRNPFSIWNILAILLFIALCTGFCMNPEKDREDPGKLFDLREQDITISLPYEDAFHLCMTSAPVFWFRHLDEADRRAGIIRITRGSWLDESVIHFSLKSTGRDTTRVLIKSGSVSLLHFPPGQNAKNLMKIFRYLERQAPGRIVLNSPVS